MMHVLGGKVITPEVGEYGKTEIEFTENSVLQKNLPKKSICWMSHFDRIAEAAPGFEVSASTADCPIAATQNVSKNLYAIQFHPEVLHTENGTKMIYNFVREVCGCAGTWRMDSFVKESIEEIRNKVGNGKVLLALSGGVDSSVAAGLLSRAIGKQLTCVFVDHGLLRKDEGDEVENVFGPNGQFDLNFIRVNAQQRYYDKLAGVTEPEQQRKIIGEEFIGDDSVAMVLGDNIFAGHGLKKRLKAAIENAESGRGATVFGYYVDDPERFGIVEFDKNGKAVSIEEKPAKPKSNLASMGIYIFSWKALRESLIALKDQSNSDFGKHIIPCLKERGDRLAAYEFNGYWKDVGTLGSYWEANMELVDIVPEFNLYEEFWKIYTKTDAIPPQYIDASGRVSRCIIGEGTEVYGDVENSVIGSGVTIEKGAVIRNSIIMNNATIGENAYMDKAIIAENVKIGKDAKLGIGEEAVNEFKPQIYSFGLVTIGENSVIPDGVTIGKNTAISGVTTPEDYPDGNLKSGGSIIKAGE